MADKFVCTAQRPWKKGDPTPAIHPDAVCTFDGGFAQEYERYECPHCKERFTIEIPQ